MVSVGSPTQPGSGQFEHLSDHSVIKAFLDAHGGDDPDHVASRVEFDPTGLIVVTGTDVQGAIQQLDSQVSGKAIPMGVWTGPNTFYPLNAVVKPPATSAYTGAWRCVSPHFSGAAFTGPTSGNWERWGAEKFSDLGDVIVGTPAVGQYAMWNGVAWVPSAPAIATLGSAGYARNASGVRDARSVVPSSQPPPAPQLQQGNTVTVTDGHGNPLTVTIPAGIGHDVELLAVLPLIYDTGPASTTLSAILSIVETSDHDASLTAAGLNKVGFSQSYNVPNTPGAQFAPQLFGCLLLAAEFPVQRKFGLVYTIFTGTVNTNVGSSIQAINALDSPTPPPAVPGTVARAGSRLMARLA